MKMKIYYFGPGLTQENSLMPAPSATDVSPSPPTCRDMSETSITGIRIFNVINVKMLSANKEIWKDI